MYQHRDVPIHCYVCIYTIFKKDTFIPHKAIVKLLILWQTQSSHH